MRKLLHKFPWRNVVYSLLLVCSVAGTALLMGAVQVKSNEQACLNVNIIIYGEGTFVSQKEISRQIEADYGPLVGRTLSTIPIHDIEYMLKKIPYVKQATIHWDMNGHLNVQIEQREPVIKIESYGNTGFYIDEMGLKMPLSRSYDPKVPHASGFIRENYSSPLEPLQSQVVKDLFAIAQYAREETVWNDHVSRIFVNEKGEIELVPRVGQQKIILGNADDLPDKFQRLLIFYKGIVPKTGLDAYKVVNLKYSGQLVCERNPHFHLDSLKTQAEVMADQTRNNNSINIP